MYTNKETIYFIHTFGLCSVIQGKQNEIRLYIDIPVINPNAKHLCIPDIRLNTQGYCSPMVCMN